LVAAFLVLSVCKVQAGHSHGNGGEGLQIENRIVLRDMVVNGQYQPPQFGPAVDPNIRQMSNLYVFEAIGVDTTLLLRKLTDIDANVPGLGIHIYAVLLSYKWELQDLLLWLTDEEDVAPAGVQRIPIAVRGFPFFRTISVARGTWHQLTPEDRVGLLIHEAVYALQYPNCVKTYCRQDPEITRSMTRFLMTATKEDPGVIDAKVVERLNYIKGVKSEIAEESAKIILKSQSHEVKRLKVSGLMVSYRFEKEVAEFCEEFDSVGRVMEVQLVMNRAPFCIQLMPLPSANVGTSMATFFVRTIPSVRKFEFTSRTRCVSGLTNEMQLWFDPGYFRESGKLFCY
jgi:hypothetical protein